MRNRVCPNSRHQSLRHHLRLLQYRINRLLLLIRRIAMFGERPFNKDHQVSSCAFPNRPVDSGIGPILIDDLACYDLQDFITQHLHGTVINFQRIVKGDFIRRKSQLLPFFVGFLYLPGHEDELLDDFNGRQKVVLISLDGRFKHFKQFPAFDRVRPCPSLEFIVENSLQ